MRVGRSFRRLTSEKNWGREKSVGKMKKRRLVGLEWGGWNSSFRRDYGLVVQMYFVGFKSRDKLGEHDLEFHKECYKHGVSQTTEAQ